MTQFTKTILLVDDEDLIVDLAAMVLESGGYRVLKAKHSDEALLLIHDFQGPVHLLLTDVKIDPFMSGCELAKCMRMLRPQMQVLYISGYLNNHVVQQEVEHMRANFLAKPFTPKDLLAAVNAIFATTQKSQ